jgi:uncharacterized membrane protein YbhN (UPF0104 family)
VIRTIAQAWRLLLTAHAEWMLLALALYCMASLAASGRWRLVVAALGGRVGWFAASLATIAGVAVNNLTPTGRLGGEACRVAVTRLKGELTLSRGALASLCDRLTDVPLICVIALLALPALPSAEEPAKAALLAIAVLVIMWFAVARWLRARLHASLTWWHREGLSIGWRTVAKGLGFSAMVWVEDVFRLMAVGRAFDVHLSAPQGAALVVVGVFGGFVPTIGGLGAVEGALVGTLLLFDVPLETAIAITTLERAISYGFSTVVGGFVVLLLGGRRLWSSAVGTPAVADQSAKSI